MLEDIEAAMHRMHYEIMSQSFPKSLILVYNELDSLSYAIESDDVNDKSISKVFDFFKFRNKSCKFLC